jgi:hypothetical protein
MQDVEKNYMLIEQGYNPIHLNNNQISLPEIKEWVKNLWQQIYSPQRGQQSK